MFLGIALSITYKTFTGGESALELIDLDYISKASVYGMFPSPIGASTGLSIFFNATLPFLEGFTPQTPAPLNRSTWNLKALTQLYKNNTIFVINLSILHNI
jgi:hypothetical protein